MYNSQQAALQFEVAGLLADDEYASAHVHSLVSLDVRTSRSIHSFNSENKLSVVR